MAERRSLTFTSLDEIMPEVDRLLAGYEQAGSWSLGQMCHHLTVAVVLSTRRGGPVEPTAEQAHMREQFLGLERFPEGRPAPGIVQPPAEADDREEVERLRAALARFAAATDPCATHPMLGPLSHKDWTRFHLMHSAHHLGFIVPK